MKFALLTLALVLVTSLDFSQACSRCSGGISGLAGRRKRDAEYDATIEAARKVLATFDDELIAKLQPELKYLTPEQRNKFYSDLQGVNIAAEAELVSVVSEYGTQQLSPKELVKTVVARIMEDFENASWLIRIRKFSGRKLENLVSEFINKVDSK